MERDKYGAWDSTRRGEIYRLPTVLSPQVRETRASHLTTIFRPQLTPDYSSFFFVPLSRYRPISFSIFSDMERSLLNR